MVSNVYTYYMMSTNGKSTMQFLIEEYVVARQDDSILCLDAKKLIHIKLKV